MSLQLGFERCAYLTKPHENLVPCGQPATWCGRYPGGKVLPLCQNHALDQQKHSDRDWRFEELS